MNTNYGFELKWLSVTSFELKFGDLTVVTDPYITECAGTDLTWEAVEKCDLICLTHAHYDHVTDIPRLVEKFKPKILCGDRTAQPLCRWLDYNPMKMYAMPIGNELDFGSVKIQAVYGIHGNLQRNCSTLDKLLADKPDCQADPGLYAIQEIGSFEYRNWLFTLPNGTKILLWGSPNDTEHTNICKEINPDILILQRGVSEKSIHSRVGLAKASGCKVLIPHHQHDSAKLDTDIVNRMGEVFMKEVPGGTFIFPKHGEWIKL